MNCSLINKSFNYQLFRPPFTSLRLGTTLCCCLALSVRRIRSQASCCRISAPRSYSSSHSGTFMEVVKAVGRQGSAAPNSVAIRADQQSYSYIQIISSAVKISNLLNNSDIKTPCEARKDEIPSLSIDGMGKQRHLGGARIGIVAKPSAEFVAGILGTWFSGGVAVPLALSYPEAELLHVMNDSVTKESFIDGGFFKTGDAGRVDEDGYYVILGRTSADIMKVGGYKLSALEIESAILEHPVVAECCVLGLPDKDYGEAVCAIIVPKEDANVKQEEDLKPAISLKELRSWAKEKLAPYKLPTRLYLWDSLPRNAMGKVNKKELKKVLAAKQ
nr:malonate--CoA ligase-like [Quercus suber]